MIHKIYKKEGLVGFGKGFSAAFYGAAIYGFAYFSIYKVLKSYFKDKFGDKVDMAICYLIASFTTEALTLIVKFPYDLIKCRLQSVNYIFKY
jgi:Mitochondrial carrier protein